MNYADSEFDIQDPSTRIKDFVHHEIKRLWPSCGNEIPKEEKKTLRNSKNSEKSSKNRNRSRRRKYEVVKKNSTALELQPKGIHSRSLFTTVIISRKAKASIKRIVTSFKKKQTYNDFKNLSGFHYSVIGDSVASFTEEPKLLSGSRTRRTWQYIRKALPLFNPNNPLKIFWDFLILSLIIVQLFILSIEKCFEEDFNDILFIKILFCFLGLDIPLGLNTKFFKDGLLISDRRLILKNYLKKKTISDIVPFLYLSWNFINYNTVVYKFLLFPILCLKWNKLKKLRSKLSGFLINNNKAEALFNLLILIIKICIWGHFIACLWHYVGMNSLQINPSGNSWLKSRSIEKSNWSERYLNSIYWAFTTMLTVGYGDIIPTNDLEIIFNIGAMFLGCCIFGYSMNSIGEILKSAKSKENLLKEQMNKVSLMMKDKNLPLETQTKVKKYLEFVWKQEQRENPEHETLIMAKLSSSLREEIYLNTYVKYLKTVPCFRSFSDKALIGLSRCMKKVRFSPEEYVFKHDEKNDNCFYFVLGGNLQLISEGESIRGKVYTKLETYKKGDFFGVQEFFSGMPRNGSVVSIDFSTLFRIERQDALSILRKNFRDYEKFCQIRDRDIIYQEHNQFEIKCKSCGFADHRINECKFLKYIPNRLTVIGRHNIRRKNFEKGFKRKVVGTQNALCSKNLNASAANELLSLYSEDTELNRLINLYKIDDLQRGKFVNSFMELPDVYRQEELSHKEGDELGNALESAHPIRKIQSHLEIPDASTKNSQNSRNLKYTEIEHNVHTDMLSFLTRENQEKYQSEAVGEEFEICQPKEKEGVPVPRHLNLDFYKREKSFPAIVEESVRDSTKFGNFPFLCVTPSKENLEILMNTSEQNPRTNSKKGSILSNNNLKYPGRRAPVRKNEASDMVRSFNFYFPGNNVENFLEKYNKFKMRPPSLV